MAKTAYIIKNTTNGKYVSSKDWYRPSVGEFPVFFKTAEEAQNVSAKIVAENDVTLVNEIRYLTDLEKIATKMAKLVVKTQDAYDKANETGVKKLVRVAELDLLRAKRAVNDTARDITLQRAAITRAEKATFSVFVVMPIVLP